MILIVITPLTVRASGSLIKILLLVILCLENVFKSVDINSLHMLMPISKIACIHVEDNEGSVFIVPPAKRDQ